MKKLPAQFLITDSKTINPVDAVGKLPKNSAVILRDYDMPEKARYELGLKLRKICRAKNIPFLVAKTPELALQLKADGMHFPEFAYEELRRMKAKKPNRIFTAAAHKPNSSRFAYMAGADAVLISPVFAVSHSPLKNPLGITRSALYIYRGLPAYALGGVKPAHVKALKMAGFCGFAGISWVKTCGYGATVGQRTAPK